MASGYRPDLCPDGVPQPVSLVLQICLNCHLGGVVLSHASLQDDTIQVEYTPGQARGVVSGDEGVTPHRYSLPRGDGVNSQWFPGNIPSRYQLLPLPDGSGYAEQKIENDSGSTNEKLSETTVKELKALVQHLEDMLLCPVDVEFAVDRHNHLYLLQVRPVTRLTGGNHFNRGLPEQNKLSGQLVSEGVCSGLPVYVNERRKPEDIPKGAILFADNARNWMLDSEVLKRVAGFVFREGGSNDHVAITLRQAEKPCLVAGDNFYQPDPGTERVTLVAGSFDGDGAAVVLEGDQSALWESGRTSLVPDYQSIIKAYGTYKSVTPSFMRPEEGFAWLTQQNERLLQYFHTDRLLHQCLSPEQSKVFSMSADRQIVAQQLQLEIKHFTDDVMAFLAGYQRLLELHNDAADHSIQSFKSELSILSSRLGGMTRQVTEAGARIVNGLVESGNNKIDPLGYRAWLNECRTLKNTIQSLSQPDSAGAINSFHDAIYFIHKRFVDALVPVALGSGQGSSNDIKVGEVTGTRINFLKPGEVSLADQQCLDALAEFDCDGATVLDLPTAYRVSAKLGIHVCEVEMFEQAEGGKGRKIRATFSDEFSDR
ncbi:PEP/pyruvate-binding domain-containing protein [Endozoicomonas ascidiicola]|nr:PEP/pyruvate-binding domain-containing protein [Endozoicomonas ascidiicola]